MDRSLRFRVYTMLLLPLLRLGRRTLKVLRLLVDIRFQVLFHSPPGVLFTFPSRYYALSVA